MFERKNSRNFWLSRTFSLSSFCTCLLTRRNMKGLRIMCNLRNWCSLSLLPLFSAAFSISLENHSLNSSCESNKLGMMKCSSAQSSVVIYDQSGKAWRWRIFSPCMEFWIGVPVRRRRFLQWKPSRVFHRTLEEFLMFCASSRIMYCHFTLWKYCWSWVTYCRD